MAEEPWRCKYCAFHWFCRMGRCAAFIPLEFFTKEDVGPVERKYREEERESGSGFNLQGEARPTGKTQTFLQQVPNKIKAQTHLK